jgi:hypothetical protein
MACGDSKTVPASVSNHRLCTSHQNGGVQRQVVDPALGQRGSSCSWALDGGAHPHRHTRPQNCRDHLGSRRHAAYAKQGRLLSSAGFTVRELAGLKVPRAFDAGKQRGKLRKSSAVGHFYFVGHGRAMKSWWEGGKEAVTRLRSRPQRIVTTPHDVNLEPAQSRAILA